MIENLNEKLRRLENTKVGRESRDQSHERSRSVQGRTKNVPHISASQPVAMRPPVGNWASGSQGYS